MAIVYRATDPQTGDSYVGYSDYDDLNFPKRRHEKDAFRTRVSSVLFDRVLKERGRDRFIWEILEDGLTLEEAREHERFLIPMLKPTLNRTRGGNGGPGIVRKRRKMLLPVSPIEGEIWRPIPGFEGIYEASDHGRIKTLARIVPNPVTGTMMRPSGLMRTPAPRGRPVVTLCRDGKEYNRKVQAIIAETFIGPRPTGLGVLHRDDNKMNNRPSNLYYGTSADNGRDKVRNGTAARGERSGNAVLTEEIVGRIIELDQQGVRQVDIVKITGGIEGFGSERPPLPVVETYGPCPSPVKIMAVS